MAIICEVIFAIQKSAILKEVQDSTRSNVVSSRSSRRAHAFPSLIPRGNRNGTENLIKNPDNRRGNYCKRKLSSTRRLNWLKRGWTAVLPPFASDLLHFFLFRLQPEYDWFVGLLVSVLVTAGINSRALAEFNKVQPPYNCKVREIKFSWKLENNSRLLLLKGSKQQ